MSRNKADNSVTARLSLAGFTKQVRVISFKGEEGISQLFELRVILSVEQGQLVPDSVLGKPAELTIESQEGTRRFHAMVNEVSFLEQTRTRPRSIFRVTLAPRAWLLTRGQNYRIFQKQNLFQIVKALLDEAKVPHRLRARGNRVPAERRFCVQYGESDWNFINRLLEEEGFFYHFSHSGSGHVLEVMDSPSLTPVISGSPELKFAPANVAMGGGEYLFQFSYGHRVRAGRVSLDDYNPEQPALELKTATPEQKREPEIYRYPGGYMAPKEGKAISRIQLETERATAEEGDGGSDCPRLAAGHCFTVSDPFQTDAPRGEYLVTQLLHVGSKGTEDLEGGALDSRLSYENSFRCVGSKTAYRAPRKTPRPVVEGVHTAVVAGRGQEEIYTDKLGRVKVRFRWDRYGSGDENSSCWVRVSQVMAGSGWGALWIPRVGQEVVVSFEQGDPDRPLITGSLYHAHNPPPFGQPAQKTRSGFRTSSSPGGGGHNELSFEDRRGAEVLRLRAQRDLREVVGRDRTTSIGRSHELTIKKDQRVTVEEGDRSIRVDKGDLFETMEGSQFTTIRKGRFATILEGVDQVNLTKGDREVFVREGDHTLVVSGTALTRVESGSYKVEVDGPAFVVRCGQSELRLEKDGSIKLVGAGGSFELGAGGIKVEAKAGTVDVSGTTINLNS